MAFPQVADTNTSAVSTAGTSHAVNLPANIVSGDRLYVFFETTGSVTPADLATWTKVVLYASRFHLYWKDADGSEGASITLSTGSTSTKSAHTSYRITGQESGTAPAVGTGAAGSSVSPDPPSVTPAWGAMDTLWIAAFGVYASGPSVSTWPTNYASPGLTIIAGGGSTSTRCAAGTSHRQLNASPEDPGTFGLGATGTWVANTVATKPAAAVPITITVLNAAGSTAAGVLPVPVESLTPSPAASSAAGIEPAPGWLAAPPTAAATATGPQPYLPIPIVIEVLSAAQATGAGILPGVAEVLIPPAGAAVGAGIASTLSWRPIAPAAQASGAMGVDTVQIVVGGAAITITVLSPAAAAGAGPLPTLAEVLVFPTAQAVGAGLEPGLIIPGGAITIVVPAPASAAGVGLEPALFPPPEVPGIVIVVEELLFDVDHHHSTLGKVLVEERDI